MKRFQGAGQGAYNGEGPGWIPQFVGAVSRLAVPVCVTGVTPPEADGCKIEYIFSTP